MNPVATQQVALDNSLLSPCYPAFLITAEVPEVYMHQFWNTIQKVKDTHAYRFKLDKKKFRVDTEELGYSGKCDMLSEIHTDQMHQPWRTFATIINRCISGKKQDLTDSGNHELKSCRYGALIPDDMINQDIKYSKSYKTYYDFVTRKVPPKKERKYKKVASPSRKLSPFLEEEPAEKPKKAKKPAKKSTTVPTAGVVIRDAPGVLISKKKAHAKGDRGKGMELLSDAALLEAAQVLDESQDKTTGIDEGTGTKPGVPDVPKYLSESENESWGDSGDDEMMMTVMKSKVTKHEEVGKGDAEMTDTTYESASHEKPYKQVIEDAHVTLTSSQKTEGSKQSSSVSSDFASKFLNLDNVPPVIDEVASMMNVKTPHKSLG
ncbi:hypothetical protein Tco_0529938 [Tanacetum coccineum]